MKKLIAGLVAVLVLAGAGFGGYYYVTSTPEYELKETVEDVQIAGLDGLREHVTDEVWDKVELVNTLTENPLVVSLMGMFDATEGIQEIKEHAEEIQWEVLDVMKSKRAAKVKLGFNYQDEITGNVELNMVKVDGKWKISGIDMPTVDNLFDGLTDDVHENLPEELEIGNDIGA